MGHMRLIGTFVLLVGLSACVDEQPLESGTWTGYVTPPGMGEIETAFDVAYRGDSLDMSIVVEGMDDRFPFYDVDATDTSLTFWWQPLMRVDCELRADEEGVFRGACFDPEGGVGPIVMAPPGVELTDLSESEQDRLEAEKWRERGALDEIDGPRGRMYDVGGTELNALVEGEGAVSVVLISDLADDLRTWDYVVHEVKDFARVISYSRPGLGHSDEDGIEPSLDRIAAQLNVLLDEAEVEPPYVLVGHAFGSVFARSFAAKHPDEVAGMVFVDPVHPEIGTRLEELDRQSWDTYWSGQRAIYDVAPDPVRAEFALYARMIEEGRREDFGDLPDVPVTVISGLRAPEAVRWVGESSEGLEMKLRLHEEIASEFSQGTHLSATGSVSYVHRENPDIVIEAIRRLVDQVQSTASARN